MKYIKLFENFTEKIIAYHGTNKKFDKFDIKFSGSSNDNGDYGKGIYFDTNIEWAAAYSHKIQGIIITAELNLMNPYYINIIDIQKTSDLFNI